MYMLSLTYFLKDILLSAFLIQLSSTAFIAGDFRIPTEMSVILLLQNIFT